MQNTTTKQMNTTEQTMTLTEYRAAGGNQSSAVNQRICDKLIERNVILCVSSMIHALSQSEEACKAAEISTDDLYCILTQDNWQEPAEEFIQGMNFDDLQLALTELGNEPPKINSLNIREAMRQTLCDAVGAKVNGWWDYCQSNRLDPYQHEALEHWVVDRWFSARLAERGEMVLSDGPFGIGPIWGRCTSGQSIAMDSVVAEIACGMAILDGQRNQWSD